VLYIFSFTSQHGFVGLSAEVVSVGDVIRELLNDRDWTQEILAAILGCSRRTVNNLCNGKSGLTPEMAGALEAASGDDPDATGWLNIETTYRLSLVPESDPAIVRRAKIFSYAPIRAMQQRGLIKQTNDADELEEELKRFFEVKSLDETPQLSSSLSSLRRPYSPSPRPD
jgi:HTH-type transcriptional regulator/antitoxin HigA